MTCLILYVVTKSGNFDCKAVEDILLIFEGPVFTNWTNHFSSSHASVMSILYILVQNLIRMHCHYHPQIIMNNEFVNFYCNYFKNQLNGC